MLFKKLVASLLLSIICSGVNADVIYSATEVEKFGDPFFMKIEDSVNGIRDFTGSGELTFNDSMTEAIFTASMFIRGQVGSAEWELSLSLFATDFSNAPASIDARCPSTPCNTTDWLYLTLDTSASNTLTSLDDGAYYDFSNLWGQFGFNASGVNVTENDQLATGIWYKDWTYVDGSGLTTVDSGTGGDINAYLEDISPSAVSAPSAFGLVSMALLAFGAMRARKK